MKEHRVLNMGNITDDQIEELLVFVKAVARMTKHKDKVYDDIDDELIAFDALITKARNITGDGPSC